MKENNLDKILSVLNEKNTARKKSFLEYFFNAPVWLIDSMEVLKLAPSTFFIKEGENAKYIFFLATGVVEAIDLRIHGERFNYKDFKEIYAFGGMEVILDIENYMTTLKTVTECIFVKIPRKQFIKWLYSDAEALKRESNMVAWNLLEEARNTRLTLFVQGADRLAFFLIKRYEYYSVKGILSLNCGRQDIADATGMCVKTVNRAINQFEEIGFITKEKRKVTVNREQYERLKEIVSKKLEL